VLEVVQDHGGWVNKFEGDAALCVFGVPTPLQDAAGGALAAARALCVKLESGSRWRPASASPPVRSSQATSARPNASSTQ